MQTVSNILQFYTESRTWITTVKQRTYIFKTAPQGQTEISQTKACTVIKSNMAFIWRYVKSTQMHVGI
jgi:hypothetical protein